MEGRGGGGGGSAGGREAWRNGEAGWEGRGGGFLDSEERRWYSQCGSNRGEGRTYTTALPLLTLVLR
ncbi:hypothetical protein E2C01_071143 [Portunus trituberculatus]|uniref:Uncharacterized protein n=1 Tax=Portunus trituberculatus TaxID=210409 RepID=A0A5B7I5G5_PORTR|nr:hypothetical protein [Portunus trituberculatus]